MDLYRISDFQTLSGEGGLLYSARWHTAGRRIVYLAASAAGAMLEVLTNLEIHEEDVPSIYTLLRVYAPDEIQITPLASLATEPYDTDYATSQALGNQWLQEGRAALAKVPSAIMPDTWNYLLNPLHPDAAQVTITTAKSATFDKRLLRMRN